MNPVVRLGAILAMLLGVAASGYAHDQTDNTANSTVRADHPVTMLKFDLSPDDGVIWINSVKDVAAEISVDRGKIWLRSDPQNKQFVSWSVNAGSYAEQIAYTTFYIAGAYGEITDGMPLYFQANPVQDDPPATSRQDPATQPTTQPATFDSELAASKSAKNRDDQVEHLRRALALRPDDDDNITVEFNIGILLGQRTPIREKDSLAVFEDIVRQYDHRKYYHFNPDGFSDSPELEVHRAAILAASILNGPIADHEAARQYAIVALQDLKWTFEKRRTDWLNVPKPTTRPNQQIIEAMHPNLYKHELETWQRHRNEAEAGGVEMLGPYGEVLIDAAIRQYALTFGPDMKTQMPKIMAQVVHDYPGTPIAGIAQQNIDSGYKKIPIP
jgi:hypothetical protein